MLQNVLGSDPFQIYLGTSARDSKAEMSLQAHALGDLIFFVQYLLPYVLSPY